VVWEEVSIAKDDANILHGISFCFFSIIIVNENKRKYNSGVSGIRNHQKTLFQGNPYFAD